MNWPRLLAVLAVTGLGAFAAYVAVTLALQPLSVPYSAAPPDRREATDMVADVERWLRAEGY